MRCPKCHYLSFEPEPRCKNCGYDTAFSDADIQITIEPDSATPLATPPTSARVPTDTLPAPVTATTEATSPAASPPVAIRPDDPAVEIEIGPRPSVAPAAAVSGRPVAQPDVTTELPLFVQNMADDVIDEPLVKMPAKPRPPLAVRRATPDTASMRAQYARPMPDDAVEQDFLDELRPRVSPPAPVTASIDLRGEPASSELPEEWRQPVGFARRFGASAFDAVLLLAINITVVRLTLYVCGLKLAGLLIVPVAPLFGFFAMLDGGYLVLLTAACGQTLGKMATGIRVVGTSAEAAISDRVTFAQATMRACATIVSLVPFGLGFWLGLGGEHRTLHDRIAHTRVVRA